MMTENKENDPYYQRQAKQYVDGLFEMNAFNEKMTRDDLQGVEDLPAFFIESNVKSAIRANNLMLSLKKATSKQPAKDENDKL